MRTLGAFVFPGFETLDYFGPIEMLGSLPDQIALSTIAKDPEPVPSVQGQRIVVDRVLSEKSDYDLLLVPGGDTALEVAKDPEVLAWLRAASAQAELVMTVCTGSILLGISGALDGKRATTNKRDFTATVPLAPDVNWVKQARWVEDGKFFTSSGVSAGMDMALAALAHLFGEPVAREMAEGCEYLWQDDPDLDPFATAAGVVSRL